MPTRTALQDAPSEGYRAEQVSAVVSDREALESIRRTFMARSQQAMSLPLLSDLTVADVVEVRSLPAWQSFKDSQAQILKDPLPCLDLPDEFQLEFDNFQRALSTWYNDKYGGRQTEERYSSYISLALSLAGKLIVAGSNLAWQEKVLAGFASEQILKNIPQKVKGSAAKLMVGVYDVGKQRLDSDRTYTIELMQTNAELTRDDVVQLLNSISRKAGAGMPQATGQVADQGMPPTDCASALPSRSARLCAIGMSSTTPAWSLAREFRPPPSGVSTLPAIRQLRSSANIRV